MMESSSKKFGTDVIAAILVFAVIIVIVLMKVQEVRKENVTPRNMNVESNK